MVKFDSVGKVETLFDISEVEPNKTTNVIMTSHLNSADQVKLMSGTDGLDISDT